MSLIAKNKIGKLTAYYYSDGAGHIKSGNGKKLSGFYTTQNEKVYFLAEWLVSDSVKKQVENDMKSLLSRGLVNL